MYLLTKEKLEVIKLNREKKWLGIILLVVMLFLIFWLILIFCGVARGEEFIYKDWNIVQVIRNSDGLWAIFFVNPDRTEMVIIVITPEKTETIIIKQKRPPSEISL